MFILQATGLNPMKHFHSYFPRFVALGVLSFRLKDGAPGKKKLAFFVADLDEISIFDDTIKMFFSLKS